ncbi:MAG: hypothetical protein EBR02_06060 [Alphaproteobacteria bacterium]|nr:hypothetical protein [Alphaproteobacteria bacterium]
MTQHESGYILEFQTHGRSIKVTAFDPKTLVEASIVGARGATQQQLAELAIRKLRYVIEKTKSGE